MQWLANKCYPYRSTPLYDTHTPAGAITVLDQNISDLRRGLLSTIATEELPNRCTAWFYYVAEYSRYVSSVGHGMDCSSSGWLCRRAFSLRTPDVWGYVRKTSFSHEE